MDLKDDDSSDENISEDPQEPRTSRSKRKKRGGPEVDASVTSSKGSVVSKKKKKGKTADGRWCKRFTWPEDLHRDFVSAIFDVGLKHSSPSTILEHMPKNDQITTERIKSHLQKYRMHRAKSKKEFATSYDHALSKLQANGLNGVKSLSAGEVPAHLAYTALQEQQQGNGNNNNISSPVTSSPMLDKSAMNNNHNQSPKQAPGRQPGGDALMLPQLTEAEKASPIGASMGYLMGLFFSLKQQLMVQRSMEARAENDKNNAPDVQAVFNSFVGSIPPSAPALAGGGPDNNMILHHDNNTNNLQNQVSFDQNSSVAASKTPSVLAAPSVRTNLEENNMMKREMQNQMAFQNKMRALKQQELNKYKNVSSGEQLKEEGNNKEKVEDMNHVHYASSSSIPMKQQQQQDEEDSKAAEAAERYQGAGEAGGADPSSDPHVRSRSRGMSMGGSDEFWNTDVVDEQLFEFLMNN
jgi:SHAQKYF class myb-like DNA-binding protein